MPGIEEGRFIVFEGIDGSGKDTISTEVFKRLNKILGEELFYVSMCNGPYYNDIKELTALPGFHMLDVAALNIQNITALDKQVKDKLNMDMTVIANRWYYSTLAYNVTEPEDEKWILENIADLSVPTLVIYLDVNIDTALSRIEHRGELDIWENEEKLKDVKKRYSELSTKYDNFIVIDANGTIESVVEKVMERITGDKGII